MTVSIIFGILESWSNGMMFLKITLTFSNPNFTIAQSWIFVRRPLFEELSLWNSVFLGVNQCKGKIVTQRDTENIPEILKDFSKGFILKKFEISTFLYTR